MGRDHNLGTSDLDHLIKKHDNFKHRSRFEVLMGKVVEYDNKSGT